MHGRVFQAACSMFFVYTALASTRSARQMTWLHMTCYTADKWQGSVLAPAPIQISTRYVPT